MKTDEKESDTIVNAVRTKSNFPIIHAVSEQLPIDLKMN